MPATGTELRGHGGRAQQNMGHKTSGVHLPRHSSVAPEATSELEHNLLMAACGGESAPTSKWDTKPTESHARACLRDVAWASLALPAWAAMRLLRLVLSLLGVSEHRWKGVPNDTVLSAADTQRLQNVLEALKGGSLDKQALLHLPPPDHYSCSSSSQAVALVLHHLYNVITALEIVVAQQGVTLGKSELAAVYSRLVKPLRKALIQSKLGGVNHQDVLKDLRHAGKSYLVQLCRDVQHVKLRSRDLVQAYFFECLMLQSLGVGSVQTRELLRVELTKLKRVGSSVGCELRAIGSSMFSSRGGTSGAALNRLATRFEKEGSLAFCRGVVGNSENGRAHIESNGNKGERGDAWGEDAGAQRALQAMSAPGFLGAATTAFDTATDAAKEGTACTQGKLGSGEVAACALCKAGAWSGKAGAESARSKRGADGEVLQQQQEGRVTKAQAVPAHAAALQPACVTSAGPFAQAFTYADGDLLPSQPAMHSEAHPALGAQTEAAGLSRHDALQSRERKQHNLPLRNPDANRRSPFAGGRIGYMSPAPSAPSAMPLPAASSTPTALPAQAHSTPVAFPDAALNPGPWHQPLVPPPSPQPAKTVAPPSTSSWLGFPTVAHSHRRRTPAQATSLPSAPSTRMSQSSVHSCHPHTPTRAASLPSAPSTRMSQSSVHPCHAMFTCHPHTPTRAASLPSAPSTRMSQSSVHSCHSVGPCHSHTPMRAAPLPSAPSTHMSLSTFCLPKSQSKSACRDPAAPAQVVEMCSLVNLNPGVEFLEAQGNDSFADHVKYMKSRSNVRPSGAKNEWLVQAMSINARAHTLVIERQDGSDVQMPTYARSGAFAVHGRKPKALGLSALLAARDAAAAGAAAAAAAAVTCSADSTTTTTTSMAARDSRAVSSRSSAAALKAKLQGPKSATVHSAGSMAQQPSSGGGVGKGAVRHDSVDSMDRSSNASAQVLQHLKQVGYGSMESLDQEIRIRSVCCIAQALPVVVAMLQHACTSHSCLAAALESGAWLYVQQSLLSDRQETEGAYLQDTEGALTLLSQRVVVRFVEGTPPKTVLVDPDTNAITILLDVGLVPDAVLQCTPFHDLSEIEPSGQHTGETGTTLEGRLAMSNARSALDNTAMSTRVVHSINQEKRLLAKMQRQRPQQEQQQQLQEQQGQQQQDQHQLLQDLQRQQQQQQQQHSHFEQTEDLAASKYRPSNNPLFLETLPEASVRDSRPLQSIQILDGIPAHPTQQQQDQHPDLWHTAAEEGDEEGAPLTTRPLLQGNCSSPIACRSAAKQRSSGDISKGLSHSLSWLKPHRHTGSLCTSPKQFGKQTGGKCSSRLFSSSVGCGASSWGSDKCSSSLGNNAAEDGLGLGAMYHERGNGRWGQRCDRDREQRETKEGVRGGCSGRYGSSPRSGAAEDGRVEAKRRGCRGRHSSIKGRRACEDWDGGLSDGNSSSSSSSSSRCSRDCPGSETRVSGSVSPGKSSVNCASSANYASSLDPAGLNPSWGGMHSALLAQRQEQQHKQLAHVGLLSPGEPQWLDSTARGQALHKSSHHESSHLSPPGCSAADGSMGAMGFTFSPPQTQSGMLQLSTNPWDPSPPLGSPTSASFIPPSCPVSASCILSSSPASASCLLPAPPFAAANWPPTSAWEPGQPVAEAQQHQPCSTVTGNTVSGSTNASTAAALQHCHWQYHHWQPRSTVLPVSCPLPPKLSGAPLPDQPSRRGSLPSKPPPDTQPGWKTPYPDTQPIWQTSSTCSMPSDALITKTGGRGSNLPCVDLGLWTSPPAYQPGSTHSFTANACTHAQPSPSLLLNSYDVTASATLNPSTHASTRSGTLHQSPPSRLLNLPPHASTRSDALLQGSSPRLAQPLSDSPLGPNATTITARVPHTPATNPSHRHAPSPFALVPSPASTHQPPNPSMTLHHLPYLDANLTTTNNNYDYNNDSPKTLDTTRATHPSASLPSWLNTATKTNTPYHPSDLSMMHLGTSLSSKAEPPLDQCSHAHADRGACIWATQPSLAHHDGSGGKSSTPAALPSGTGGGGVSAAGGDADHPCLLAMTNHRKRQVLLERSFRLHTCLFNQGINIMQSLGTLKLRLRNEPSLQERINLDGLQRLNAYAACASRSDGPALRALNHHYSPAGVRAVKDVHAISLVRRAVAELGGVRGVNCKSGKDRTALELAQSLSQDAVEAGQLSPHLQAALVRDLQAGLSYMQTGENNGQPSAYAFSETELVCLPPGWSPKWQLCGKVMS